MNESEESLCDELLNSKYSRSWILAKLNNVIQQSVIYHLLNRLPQSPRYPEKSLCFETEANTMNVLSSLGVEFGIAVDS